MVKSKKGQLLLHEFEKRHGDDIGFGIVTGVDVEHDYDSVLVYWQKARKSTFHSPRYLEIVNDV